MALMFLDAGGKVKRKLHGETFEEVLERLKNKQAELMLVDYDAIYNVPVNSEEQWKRVVEFCFRWCLDSTGQLSYFVKRVRYRQQAWMLLIRKEGFSSDEPLGKKPQMHISVESRERIVLDLEKLCKQKVYLNPKASYYHGGSLERYEQKKPALFVTRLYRWAEHFDQDEIQRVKVKAGLGEQAVGPFYGPIDYRTVSAFATKSVYAEISRAFGGKMPHEDLRTTWDKGGRELLGAKINKDLPYLLDELGDFSQPGEFLANDILANIGVSRFSDRLGHENENVNKLSEDEFMLIPAFYDKVEVTPLTKERMAQLQEESDSIHLSDPSGGASSQSIYPGQKALEEQFEVEGVLDTSEPAIAKPTGSEAKSGASEQSSTFD